jgi:2-methylcitrate dehydratase PrpD
MYKENKIMSATETLVDYILDSDYHDIPKKVRENAQLLILDAIGCAFGGQVTSSGKIFIEYTREISAKKESTIIGTDIKTHSSQAAFTNAELANALDYSDSGPYGHPGSTIIPAALAISEKINASGEEMLHAIILGYEVGNRVALAIRPSFERSLLVRGIGTPQVFGAVTAAGKLLGLSKKKFLSAFGIAGSYTPIRHSGKFGLYEEYPYKRASQPHVVTWIKDNIGRPSEAGVLAALLAGKGFLASTSILDGMRGFWAMAGSDQCDFDVMMNALGEEYYTMKVGFKPYPACRYVHTCLDALSEILEEQRLRPEDIDKIYVDTVRVIAESFVDYEPLNMYDAQFSIPYPASMIIYGVPRPEWYLEKNFENLKYLQMAKKVIVNYDKEAEERYLKKGDSSLMPSTVKVITKNKEKFVKKEDYPKGSPENPWSKEEVFKKFFELTTIYKSNKTSEEILSKITNLEKVEKINDLAQLLLI